MKTQLRVWVHRYNEWVWRRFWGERFWRQFPKGRGQEIQTEARHWLHCLASLTRLQKLEFWLQRYCLGWTSPIQDPKTYTSGQRSFSTTQNHPKTTGRVKTTQNHPKTTGRVKVQPTTKSDNDSKETWAYIVGKNPGRLVLMKFIKLPWWQNWIS